MFLMSNFHQIILFSSQILSSFHEILFGNYIVIIQFLVNREFFFINFDNSCNSEKRDDWKLSNNYDFRKPTDVTISLILGILFHKRNEEGDQGVSVFRLNTENFIF